MQLTEADISKAYASACDAIQSRVRHRVGAKCYVVFSAYQLDVDKLPIDNLDDVPVPGNVKIKGDRTRTARGSRSYESQVLVDSSWLELCVIANEQIMAGRSRDQRQRYLERIEVVEQIGDIQFAVFHIGG
jgi:hypothetical protein